MTARFQPLRFLHTRITFTILCLIITSLWALSFFTSRLLRDDIHQLLAQQQVASATMVVDRINDELDTRMSSLQKIAEYYSSSLVKNPDALQELLNHRPIADEQFNGGIFLRSRHSTTITGVLPSEQATVTSIVDNVITTVFKESKPSIGKLVISNDRRHAAFAIAAPVYDDRHQVIGVITGIIKLQQPNFLNRITANTYGKTGGYLIGDQQHRIIISATDKSRVMEVVPAQGRNLQFDQFLQENNKLHRMTSLRGVQILASSTLVPKTDWMLATVLPTDEAFAPIRRMERHVLIGTVILTILAATIGWLVLRRQLAPLVKTVQTLDEMTQSKHPALNVLPVDRDDEIGTLIKAFNRLLATLDYRETQLRKSELFGLAIIDSVDAEIAVLDQDGVIVMVNKPWRAFASANYAPSDQLPPNTGVGSNYLDICKASRGGAEENDGQNAHAGILAVLKGRLPNMKMEYTCDSPLTNRWFSMVVTPLDHEITGVVVSHTDITDRKLAEHALQLTRISITAASDALFWLTKQGDIIDANPAACSLLGHTQEQILQLNVSNLSTNPQYQLENWPQHFAKIKNNNSVTFQSTLSASCGRIIPVEISTNYVQHGKEELICAFVRDITNRKRNEALLLAAKAAAEDASKAKSRFLAAASHDLRQPLSALTLYIDLLKLHAVSESNEIISSIDQCVSSLSELLTDLLDISKLDANAITPKKTTFSLGDLLTTLVSVYSVECHAKGLQLRVQTSNIVLHSDRQLMHRIIGNLISNAIRYTNTGGVLIACRRREGKTWLEVWDTGVGIANDHTETIFEEFKQLGDNARNRGSGLGLSIVSKMAVLLGMQIRVRSRLGRGSVFALELPLSIENLPQSLHNHSDASTTRNVGMLEHAPKANITRIAIIDDNPQVLNALAFSLENNGYQVVAANTGAQLIDSLGDIAPDLIISDYRLTNGQYGYGVIDAVKEKFGATLPAIIMTGDTDPVLMRSMAARGIPIVYKPLQFETLQAAMIKAISQGST